MRSDEVWLAEEEEIVERHLDFYFQHVQKIVLPIKFEDLERPVKPKELEKLQDIVNGLIGPSHPARCTSAIYLDQNDKPILFYFGRRLVSPNGEAPHNVSIFRFFMFIIEILHIILA